MNHFLAGCQKLIGGCGVGILCLMPLPSLAALAPNLEGLPPQVIGALRAPTTTPVVSNAAPSQLGLTIPSLWWVAEQFGGRLISGWRAYPGANQGVGRVDMRVRSEVWNRYSYLDRYGFVTHIGLVSSDFGYNLLVFDFRQNIVAAYTCDFEQSEIRTPSPELADNSGIKAPPYCQVWLNPNFSTRLF
jgi:hypothetical protein